jgi:hypothetical protein
VTGDRGEEEAEIRRITLQSKPRQAVCENLSQKKSQRDSKMVTRGRKQKVSFLK